MCCDILHTDLEGSSNDIVQGKGKPVVEEQQSRQGSTPKDEEYSPMVLKRKEQLQ